MRPVAETTISTDQTSMSGSPVTANAVSSVLFVPLAQNQALFYIAVAEELRDFGIACTFASYHEASVANIEAAGFRCFNVHARVRSTAAVSSEAAREIAARFGVSNLNLAISHERAAYEIRDSAALIQKFAAYLIACEGLLEHMLQEGPVTVVHELGGFLSVLAVFYAARHLGVPNIFVEPSFFKGRVFLTLNSYGAPQPSERANRVADEVTSYLERIIEKKQLVIPSKDTAHYRTVWQKVTSPRNVKRLVQKTFEKHVLGHQEEFNHIGGHVTRHLRMLATSRRLERFYRHIPKSPFIYYPFHVPADVALTLRSPEYFDQYAVIDYLARVAPPTHKVVLKEHPAQVGAVSYSRIRELLERYDNIELLAPTINNHDVMSAAAFVVTVNSKSGAEAILYGRPVVVLGDAFYRDSGLVTPVSSLQDLAARLADPSALTVPDRKSTATFFQSVWDSSWPGELYWVEPENTATFACSLKAALPLTAV